VEVDKSGPPVVGAQINGADAKLVERYGFLKSQGQRCFIVGIPDGYVLKGALPREERKPGSDCVLDA
jgi:hypothetical protein